MFVNFRPTVSRGCLLSLTSQEDWTEIVCYNTLILPAMINTVIKFPRCKFRFNWMNISLFVPEFLLLSVSRDVRGSQRCFVNKAWLGQLGAGAAAVMCCRLAYKWLTILKYCKCIFSYPNVWLDIFLSATRRIMLGHYTNLHQWNCMFLSKPITTWPG